MKKCLFLVLLLAFALMCFFSACSVTDYLGLNGGTPAPAEPDEPTTEEPVPHIHAWGELTADAAGHARGCTTCDAVEEAAHTPVVDPAVDATCGEDGKTAGSHCEVCLYVIEAQRTVPATGEHSSVPCDLVPPTFTEEGCLSGEQCTICGEVTGGEQTLPAIDTTCSTYVYDTLAARTNGAALQAFYRDLYDACAAFHTDSTADAVAEIEDGETRYVAVKLSFAAYNLSSDDAFLVLHAIRTDCPIFYWIGNKSTTLRQELSVYTDAAYVSGVVRSAYNETVYEGIAILGYPPATAYESVFYLHDTLIDRLTYAYEPDGITPSDAEWAHNILGFFLYDTGVCETYAEVFSLMLNYWSIDNALVSGTADGGPHAWNMVKMENGAWYWFDLTWDDQPAQDFGRIYRYFCKTDADFGMSSRTIETSNYPLPTASPVTYAPPIPAPDTSFSLGAMTYLVVGYREVELTAAAGIGLISVPARVTYENCTYETISIGKVQNNTLMAVFSSGVTAVRIPATVWNIRGGAFQVAGLTTVMVDETNPYLLAENGVAIYRRDPVTLVCYLPTATAKTFSLRTDTTGIEAWAIVNTSVRTIEIPATLTFIGYNGLWGTNAALTIHYAGTREDWAKIVLQTPLPTCSIICTNGTLTN